MSIDPDARMDQADLTANFAPVQKKRAFEQIIDQLELMIRSGELKAGDRLPNERALSQMLNVSRPSLREALRVLEGLDIITVRPGAGAASGAVIATEAGGAITSIMRMHLALDHFSPRDLIEMRRVIESATVRAACTNRTPEQLEQLRTLLCRMEARTTDPEAFSLIDAQFHIAIAQAAGNELMTRLMQALRDPIVHAITVTVTDSQWARANQWITPQHRAIFNAINDRKPTVANKAMCEHLKFYDDSANRPAPAAAPH